MDDPWGSPWATADTKNSSNLEPPAPVATSSRLELPPRTLSKLPSFSTHSPWDNEGDGFGGWRGSPELPAAANFAAAATNGSLNAWAGWAGETGSNSSQPQLTPVPRDSLDQPSPIAWPAAVTSPGFPPPSLAKPKTLSRRSSARSLFRQPSPDPWATEFSESQSSRPNSTQFPFPGALPPLSNVIEEIHDRTTEEKEEDKRPSANAKGKGKGKEVKDPPDLSAFTWQEEAKNIPVAPVEDTTEDAGDGGNGYQALDPDLTVILASSRRSSSSEDSRHNEERQDSPITSMDEDARDHPYIQRRVSAKVHELVNMFEKKVEETLAVPLAPPPGNRQRSTSRGAVSIKSTREDGAEDGDFGDFEDGEGSQSFVASRRPSVDDSAARPASRHDASATSQGTVSPAVPDESISERFQGLLEKFGPVKFTADLETVDQLFDKDKLDAEQPSWKDYSLDAADSIIKDSFTSISERKTWYRISRQGPARKHNTGDDENYRRVAWLASEIRNETTKIVRRWMDENSFSGTFSSRPAFGGGPSLVKGGGMFNWDSKAEPVRLDQVFGKRKSVEPPKATTASAPPARPLSLQPHPTGPPPSHAKNLSLGGKSVPTRSSPLSIPAPPAQPVFGWSTASVGSSTPGSSRPASQVIRQSVDISRPGSSLSKEMMPPKPEPESRSSLQLPPLAVSSSLTIDTKVEPFDDDDDDDWGEMVASPPSNSRPPSGFFDSGFSGAFGDAVSESPVPVAHPLASVSVPASETSATLHAVSSRLQQNQVPVSQVATVPATTYSSDPWDFSLFDSTPAAPPAPAGTASTPTVSFFDILLPQQTPPPTKTTTPPPPPAAAPQPIRHQVSKSVNGIGARMPQNGISRTPQRSTSLPPSQIKKQNDPLVKSVSFATSDEDDLAVRRIVDALPNLSYMLR